MKRLSVLIGAWLASAVALVGQSPPLSPVFVVRLDAPPAVAGEARQQGVPIVSATPKERAAAGPLQPLPVTRIEDSTAAAILDAPRTLSLRFRAPQPVRQVLLLLVRDTGLSLVASGDVDGTFTGELSGVTLRQALDLVLGAQGLAYQVDGNAIRVFRRELETRILDVNAIAARREGATAGDTFDELAESARTLLSPSGRLGVDRKAGLVHVTDYPERVAAVTAYVESLERRLNRQVDILARVVEVTFASPDAPGVNWNDVLGQARVGGGSVPSIDFDRFLAALATQGRVNVLTSSEVKALHNEPAIVRVGIEGPAFDGLALAVTPHIAADGTILMTVAPRMSHGVAEPGAASSGSPRMAISDVSTAVRVRDGETLVLPGIRQARSETAVLLTTKVM